VAAEWRVELNAMTTAEFVAWMTTQFAKYAATKVIPSEQLALAEVSENISATLLSRATAEVSEERSEELEELRVQLQNLEAEIAEEAQMRADERLREIKWPAGSIVVEKIKAWLEDNNLSHWRHSISDVAAHII
jgi:EAL domain-containing protein (putative c-di-GMP-specific phosphodiesterase class I)